MDNKCTIVVSSCDKYEDLWEPFFSILKANWPELDYQIVLNTETKKYKYPGLEIKTFSLCTHTEMSWTRRLQETLKRIYSEYVLLLLDDFFFLENVDNKRFLKALDYISSDKRIASMCFMETFSDNIKDGKYDGFEKRPWIAKYKLNCQAALWRRKKLIKYLNKDESPWEWEELGNWRTYRNPFDKFYSQISGEGYVFPYIYGANGMNWGGLALYRGKWYLPYVQPLFEKHGINMDFSIRGIVSDEDFDPNVIVNEEVENTGKRLIHKLRPIYVPIIYVISNISHFF